MYRRESAHVIPPPCGARRAIARPPRWCKSRRRNWLRLSDRLGPTAEPIRVYPTFSCVLPCAFYPVLSFAGNRGTIRGVVWVDRGWCCVLLLTMYSLYIKYVCVLLLSSVSFRFACSFTIRFAARGFCLRARFLQRRIQTIPSPVFSVASLLLYAAALAQRERDANAGSQ